MPGAKKIEVVEVIAADQVLTAEAPGSASIQNAQSESGVIPPPRQSRLEAQAPVLVMLSPLENGWSGSVYRTVDSSPGQQLQRKMQR